MIALIIVISFMAIGLGALVHAIKNAPLIDEKGETIHNHNLE